MGILGGLPDVVLLLAAEWLSDVHEKLGDRLDGYGLPLGEEGVVAPDGDELVDVLDVGLEDVVVGLEEA